MNPHSFLPGYSGSLQHGLRHGYGVYQDHVFQYAGMWAHDSPHGKGTRQARNGMMEHGEFEHGVLAIGRRAWPNGDFEEGRFIHGQLAAGKRQRAHHYEEGEFITSNM